ncbi:MAG: hypothetical protein J6V72_03750, partial [Kiritimatiellae bacterium]|nr:hypothetical protein [Kiritimatiellia bacterium]
ASIGNLRTLSHFFCYQLRIDYQKLTPRVNSHRHFSETAAASAVQWESGHHFPLVRFHASRPPLEFMALLACE